MNNGNIQLALIAEAKRLKKEPEDLTSAEITAVALRQRSMLEALTDGAKAVESYVATKTGIRTIPLEVVEARKGPNGCGGCPMGGISADGRIYCKVCGCAGVLMEAALNDPNQACRLPAGQRRWEKYVEPS